MFGKDDPIEPLLVNSRTAAKLLSISERKLFDLRKGNVIPSTKVGGKVLYPLEGLRAFARDFKNHLQNPDSIN